MSQSWPDSQVAVEVSLPDLLLRSSQGDQAAFAELYDRLAHRVFGLSLHLLGDRAHAEEAALETFTQVWRQSRNYDPARGSVLGWVLTIARTRALDLRRARRIRSDRECAVDDALETPDPRPGPESAAAEAQEVALVRRALDALPREQRVLIEAAYYRGLSHSELATAFAQPLGTVKTRIRNGLISLRSELAQVRKDKP